MFSLAPQIFCYVTDAVLLMHPREKAVKKNKGIYLRENRDTNMKRELNTGGNASLLTPIVLPYWNHFLGDCLALFFVN